MRLKRSELNPFEITDILDFFKTGKYTSVSLHLPENHQTNEGDVPSLSIFSRSFEQLPRVFVLGIEDQLTSLEAAINYETSQWVAKNILRLLKEQKTEILAVQQKVVGDEYLIVIQGRKTLTKTWREWRNKKFWEEKLLDKAPETKIVDLFTLTVKHRVEGENNVAYERLIDEEARNIRQNILSTTHLSAEQKTKFAQHMETLIDKKMETDTRERIDVSNEIYKDWQRLLQDYSKKNNTNLTALGRLLNVFFEVDESILQNVWNVRFYKYGFETRNRRLSTDDLITATEMLSSQDTKKIENLVLLIQGLFVKTEQIELKVN